MGAFVSLGAKNLLFCSRRVRTTMSQAGMCWEMALCQAALAHSPVCQSQFCPHCRQSKPWALPSTPCIPN